MIFHKILHIALEYTWDLGQPSNYCLICGYPKNELFGETTKE